MTVDYYTYKINDERNLTDHFPNKQYKCSLHGHRFSFNKCYKKYTIVDMWNDQEDMRLKDIYTMHFSKNTSV